MEGCSLLLSPTFYVGVPFCKAGSPLHRHIGTVDFGPLKPFPGDSTPDSEHVIHAVVPMERHEARSLGVQVPDGHTPCRIIMESPLRERRQPNPNYR